MHFLERLLYMSDLIRDMNVKDMDEYFDEWVKRLISRYYLNC